MGAGEAGAVSDCFDPAALRDFATLYPETPGVVRHRLVGHPLFELEALARLAQRMRPQDVEQNIADLPIGVDPADVAHNGLSVTDTIRSIEQCGAWMVLKFVEQDAEYRALMEQALVDHIQKFLLELGTGFAFVGRQVRLEVGDEDYPLDLLFYHLKLRRYVVIELKARAFIPGDVGQLNLYLSAVDDLLRHPDDQPTIGLLLCRKKNKLVAEYALRGLDQSIAVAAWQTQLTESLPEELRSSLPSIEEIEAELANDLPPV